METTQYEMILRCSLVSSVLSERLIWGGKKNCVMSFQFGSRSYGGNNSCPQPQASMGGYGQNYGYGNQMQMNPMSFGGGNNYGGNYGGGQQMQMMGQQQQQQHDGSPRVSVLSPGQQPDPGMKVIKLNWGDLLGSGGPSGMHPLKVAMVGPNGDLNTAGQGLKVTFNGEVPQGMPCHVMNINPYANIMGQGPGGR
ncbi:unnamed protein product [Allacma fusca]|uniref:Uncharacterized protein n=1 Tax=Allacma fusca TaxID=39272 RepID=A0A8J2P9D6_9HEXA|nr:unnamed protein product [Allacma fusca]